MSLSIANMQAFWQRLRPMAISLFILFFVYSVSVWSLPHSKLRTAFLLPVKHAFTLLGLNQGFHTFAPDPPRKNSTLYAEVRFSDNSIAVWNYPKLDHLSSYSQILQASQYRILWTHHLSLNSLLRADFAKYVARINNDNPQKRPVFVKLFSTLENIPKIDPATGNIQPAPPKGAKLLYECAISKEDLG